MEFGPVMEKVSSTASNASSSNFIRSRATSRVSLSSLSDASCAMAAAGGMKQLFLGYAAPFYQAQYVISSP